MAITDEDRENVFYPYNDNPQLDEEAALSVLLREGVLFANERDYHDKGKRVGSTVVLFVLCSDLFAWGGTDSEDLSYSEIGPLFESVAKDKRWGVSKWCCRKRGMQPQQWVRDKMKADGAWEDWMDSLALPEPS